MAATSMVMVVPGHLVANAGEKKAGVGTYETVDGIYASVAGHIEISDDGVVRVKRPTGQAAIGSSQVLHLGDVVVGRIVKLTARQAMVDILVVGDNVLRQAFPGTIRREDVRTHDVDSVIMEQVLPLGQLVKATVLSFGDSRSYFLSTAQPGLGAIQATP